MSDLAKLLAHSSLALAGEAVDALRSGWSSSSPRVADARELSQTYRVRLEILRAKSGPHAAQLADGVAELLPNLASQTAAKVCSLSGPAEHGFVIFLSEHETQVLGCLKVVSKLDVPSERWEELWQGAV